MFSLQTEEQLSSECYRLRRALENMDRAVERLDEAMASPEQIARDTSMVGGFVSGVNIAYTAKEVI